MNIKFHKSAVKFLKRQSVIQQERLIMAINILPNGDVKPLQGKTSNFRLRVGNYRVIFNLEDDSIYVLEIGNRGDIYK